MIGRAARASRSPGWLLAVDTALREAGLLVAVAPDGEVLDGTEMAGGDRELAVRLAQLFLRHRGRLVAVVAGRGPGSYTGLRSGVAAALGAAQARGCPLRTCPSLQVTAATVEPGGFPLLAIHPAGRGAHHRQLFRAGAGGWAPAGAAELVPRDRDPLGAPGGGARVACADGVDPGVAAAAAAAAAPVVRGRAEALALVAAAVWRGGEGAAGDARDGGYRRVHLDYGAATAGPAWS